MNRDFEFKQLLRAYRAGIINEATFEKELADIERGVGNGDGGRSVEALGKTYGSEREAVVALLDRFRAGETGGQAAFSGWEKQVSTDCIRSGIRMIAEREGYHSRIFERRLADLGAECKAGLTDFGRKFTEKLSDPKMSDNDKLLYIASLAPDPEAFWKPVSAFVDRIKDDQESKELFKLYIQDELSSGKWLMYACEALNGPAKAPSAQMGVAASEAL
ncbi:MAG: hypothetical protein IVW54_19670 [Candidatus Binataceae bacterium]|nr:hypothetical protein [Candidatus Binataceae bacterium]